MSPKPVKNQKYYAYLRYSGLAFQLATLIWLAMFVGSHIEGWLHIEKPFIQLLLILFFFSGFIYKLYIEIIRDK